MKNLQSCIVLDSSVCHGKPVFRGTRVLVSTVLELLESGMSVPDILRGFPSIDKRAVQAAIQYARLRIENEEFIPLVG